MKVEMLKNLGTAGAASRYAKHFGLSASQNRMLVDYMKLWSVLRQCCGEQMSRTWRRHLTHEKREKPSEFKNETIIQLARDCNNVNMTENLLMRTSVFTKFVKQTGCVASLNACF